MNKKETYRILIIGSLEEKSHLRNKIYDSRYISPAMLAAMGAGGGFVPLIFEVENE